LHLKYKHRNLEVLAIMLDYKDIGARIRKVRKERKLKQSELANAVGVGTTHISHIETGDSIPSLQVVVDIINVLDCSADEILCMDVKKARPFLNSWLSELVADCSEIEVKHISEMVVALKASMRRLNITEEYLGNPNR